MNSETYQRTQTRLAGLIDALDYPEDTRAAAVAEEVADLGHRLLNRLTDQPRHLAYADDRIPALRVRIDERINRLAEGFEDCDDDPLADLIADLVEYRIALWTTPVPYLPVEELHIQATANRTGALDPAALKPLAEEVLTSFGEFPPAIQLNLTLNGVRS